MVEIPGRGEDRDFAEWQKVSWEEGLEARSQEHSESITGGGNRGIKQTRGMQPTRGRGREDQGRIDIEGG